MASDSILWTIKFRNGNIKRFKFPIRTTIPGQMDIYSENITVDMSKIKEPGLYSHQARVDVLPVPTEVIPAA